MPVAYAVTYMFGTVGSAIVIALLGPALLRIDLVAACKDYEEKHGGSARSWAAPARPGTAGRCAPSACSQGGKAVGLRAVEAEALVPDARVFVQRIRRNGTIEDATADTVLQRGRRGGGRGRARGAREGVGESAQEVEDPELLDVPVEGVDVFVTNKAVDGKTLAELAELPGGARRLPAQDHARRDRHRRSPSCRTPRSSAATSSPSSAARRTPPPPPSCWASPIGRPTSPTSRSSAPRS